MRYRRFYLVGEAPTFINGSRRLTSAVGVTISDFDKSLGANDEGMNMEERNRLKGIIEAVLFTMGESVNTERLAAVLEISVEELTDILKEMKADYAVKERGICLIELDGAWQICTKIETYDYVRKLVSQPKKRSLTDVMLETLSIIAYKQPVTKQEIEAIRGVKSDFAVNKLVEYGLIKELGRLDTIGRPIVFGTTEEFLRCFGVSSIEELTDIDEVTTQAFMEEAMDEVSAALNVSV